VVHLLLSHLGVDGHGDAAGSAHREAGQELVVGVGRGHDHPVAGDDVDRERSGQPVDPVGPLGMGQDGTVDLLDQPAIATRCGGLLEEAAEGRVPPGDEPGAGYEGVDDQHGLTVPSRGAAQPWRVTPAVGRWGR
jgi:hypothetical protein